MWQQRDKPDMPLCRAAVNPEVEDDDHNSTLSSDADGPEPAELTARAVVAGLVIGSLLCGSNMHFGLQTGDTASCYRPIHNSIFMGLTRTVMQTQTRNL